MYIVMNYLYRYTFKNFFQQFLYNSLNYNNMVNRTIFRMKSNISQNNTGDTTDVLEVVNLNERGKPF